MRAVARGVARRGATWQMAAWCALTFVPAFYGVYLLVQYPRYGVDPRATALNKGALVLSIYGATAGAFGLVSARARVRNRLSEFAASPAFWRCNLYIPLLALLAGAAAGHAHGVAKEVFRGTLVLGAVVLLLAALLPGRSQTRNIGEAPRSPWKRFSRRVIRALDLALFNLLLAGVAAEILLSILALASDSVLFMRFGSANKIERALRPGLFRMGFVNNSRGYYDTEFTREKAAGSYRIVALGDSFAAGIVSYPHNVFTRVEDLLNARDPDSRGTEPPGARSIEVYNMGVNGIDAGDYRYLFLSEGVHYSPDLTVVLFFLGNDFGSASSVSPLDPNYWYVYFLPKRLFAIGLEAHRRGVDWEDVGSDKEDPWKDPAYYTDPTLEPPSYSVDTYLGKILGDQLRFFRSSADGARLRKEEENLRVLQEIFRAARQVPGSRCALVLAPAEFQVDPACFQEALAYHGWNEGDFDLEAPGRVLSRFCEREGVPCLDLTPELSRVQAESGRVYHLRDMHWNVRGNEAAARAIARFLTERVLPGQ